MLDYTIVENMLEREARDLWMQSPDDFVCTSSKALSPAVVSMLYSSTWEVVRGK